MLLLNFAVFGFSFEPFCGSILCLFVMQFSAS